MTGSLKSALQYLGKEVEVVMDRPIGSKHPTHGFVYETNYGFVEGVKAPDGEDLDAYYLGVHEPVDKATGICIAIAHRLDDDDDKLIVVPYGVRLTDENILSAIRFQERWFTTKLVRAREDEPHTKAENVTLIGMPGAGKSFVGRKLAEALAYSLVEPDTLLEEEYDLPLQTIVKKLGAEAFLDEEAKITIARTGGQEKIVISPGGSIVYRTDAMTHLKKISRVVYLSVPLSVLEQRIGGIPRGIVNIGDRSFAQLYTERTPLYEGWADHTIRGDRGVDAVVADIVKVLEKAPDGRCV